MFWPPVKGDSKAQTERWNVTGVVAGQSDRGRLFCKITATALELYKDREMASGDKVAEVTGGHGSPTTFTKKTLTAANSSGLGGSVYLKYDSADSTIEVYPLLATDTELATALIDFSRWPKESGETTFERQHIRAREVLVQKLLQTFPPRHGWTRGLGGSFDATHRGDANDMWRMNDVGEWELRKLANVWSYRQWAVYWTIAQIARQANKILKDTDQLPMVEQYDKLSDQEFGAVAPLVDFDEDYDPDVERNRFRVMRG